MFGADEGINELVLVDFAGWCSASQGYKAGTQVHVNQLLSHSLMW